MGGNDPLGLETGPRSTPINGRRLELDHGSQWISAGASHSGDALGIHKDRSALLKNRLNCDGGTAGELMIGDSEVLDEDTWTQLTNIGRDL